MLRRGQIQLRGRVIWKARRFQLLLRYGPGDVASAPIIFGNAIPKCGSKLLFNILRALQSIGPCVDTGLNEIKPFFHGELTSQAWINAQLDALRPGDLRFGYLYADPESMQRLTADHWASFMILRDPRDQVVSELHYAMHMHAGHAMHDYLHDLPDTASRLAALIEGVSEGPARRVGVREHYERFMPWLIQPEIHVVRFEDLINAREMTLSGILDHLERHGFKMNCTRDLGVQRLAAAMTPSRSETFRQGKSGGWVNTFSPENTELFKAVAGELLVQLGYESDLNW